MRDVKFFRENIQDALVRLYQIPFKGVNDPNIELVNNLLTSIIIKDELYVFLQCIITLQYKDEIQALDRLFERAKNNINVDLTYLDVKQEFKLNPKATFK